MLGSAPPGGKEPDWSNDGSDQHPVMWTSWDDAAGYARRARVALPTEAQWEYSARGRQYQRYPWGSEWDASRCQSIAERHGFEFSTPAGRFPGGASWCGAFDLAGNMWEWCDDWFEPYSWESASDPVVDSRGADPGSGKRVLRGGSWASEPVFLRCAARRRVRGDHAALYTGFRCLAD